jgi:iron complex transport system substrate-binding protein
MRRSKRSPLDWIRWVGRKAFVHEIRLLNLPLRAMMCWLALGATPAGAQPQRIVSLDFCADQYVLRLSHRAAIAALSRGADGADSYERESARGLPQVRATLEEVAPLRPDLVVRSYGGGPTLEAGLARRGIPVMNVGWVEDIDGMVREVRRVGAALGQRARGEALARSIEERRRLLALGRRPGVSALYLTPGGVTAGRGTMVDAIFREAGVTNLERRRGWQSVPLEALVRNPPQRVVLSFFDLHAAKQDAWSVARHPVMRRILAKTPSVAWPAAWTACPSWGALDAAESLQRAAHRRPTHQAAP